MTKASIATETPNTRDCSASRRKPAMRDSRVMALNTAVERSSPPPRRGFGPSPGAGGWPPPSAAAFVAGIEAAGSSPAAPAAPPPPSPFGPSCIVALMRSIP
ncbi:hypothetical protein GCM10007164_02000 [Luteimonas padinae]|nr:hypothetical protein GCM10007164_02000 [Luteimonas padinae]